MTVQSETMGTIVPAWAQESFLRAIWAEAGASVESIAARTYDLLSRMGEILGITRWDLSDGGSWEGEKAALADIIRRNPVRGRPDAEFPKGEAYPNEGYSLTFLGNGREISTQLSIHAGQITVGRRMPSHRLTVSLKEIVPGSVTGSVGDAICAAIAETWKPANIMLTETIANRIARRSNWKILVGYRTWINATVGAVTQVAEGLTLTKLAGGALVSAPDDWPAERVVEAMTATLRANGLDEVPH
ncbi:Uncharacterised protein [Mycobacteroides abscessus subsp. massiliense]|nr:Uncharacterised protein [Mycobacteroides abscessus subsp. massiliense]